MDVEPLPEVAPEPQVVPVKLAPKKTKRIRRPVVKHAVADVALDAAASTPERARLANDPLAGIMGCGDDPICGL